MTDNQKRKLKTNLWGWGMALPLILGLALFTVYPFVASFVYSFFEYDGGFHTLAESPFVGFSNYVNLFKASNELSFLHALKITATYTLISVPLGLVLGYLLATFLCAKIKGNKFLLVLYYFPTLISTVIMGSLWGDMLNPEYGIFNTILKDVFKMSEGIPFTDKHHLMASYIWMTTFNMAGGSIIWIAGISGVDRVYYEAAEIDGASKVVQFFKITIPLTTSYIFYNLIIGMIGALQLFNQPYVLTKGSGGDGGALFTVEMAIFNTAFRSLKMGAASAMAWILCLIIAVLVGITFKFSNKWVKYADEM